MITTFDPATLLNPVHAVVDKYLTDTQSPAIAVRITGPNQTDVDVVGVVDTVSGRPAKN